MLACAGADAAPTRMMMPEDTYDMYLGAALAIARGGYQLQPTLSVQWSNGLFSSITPDDGLGLGWHLSDDPTCEYGPLLAVRSREQRSDTPDGKGGLGAEAGAFYTWHVAYNIDLSSRLMYGGGSDGRGLYGLVGASYSARIDAHNYLEFDAGVALANQPYLQSYFGVTPSQSA